MDLKPRAILAPNASPMTLDGTVTFLVGERDVAIIDPGSAADSHLDAIVAAVGDASSVRILLTHDHPDHSGGARPLARRLDARIFASASGLLRDGSVIPTDRGELVAVATPGHAPDHVAFHWPAARAVFCGDLMMGGHDTSVVAAPEGDLAAYLASLGRLRQLAVDVIYPSHGPAFTDPAAALDRYVAHRVERERQVLDAIAAGRRDLDAITDHVYGHFIDPALRSFARSAVQAYLTHIIATGRFPADDES